MYTREEKLFISMQQRLQQAALNDRERRMLLAQHESRMISQKNQVKSDAYVTLYNYSDSCCRKMNMSLNLLTKNILNQQLRYVFNYCFKFLFSIYTYIATYMDVYVYDSI